MQSAVLAELRLLASADLDSHILLTIVLAGDCRPAERLRADEFLPLASRMWFAMEINANRRLTPIVSMPTISVAKLSPAGC
jgi:general secretion pathway protein A